MDKRSENAKDKFDRLVKAADYEFFHTGYEKTTISSITKKAGVAVGTFYLYFEDKFSLYSYLLFDYQTKIKEHIKEKSKNCKTRYEKEKMGFVAWLEYARDHESAFVIIWQSLAINKELFVNYYRKFSNTYKHSLERDQKELMSDSDFYNLTLILMGASTFLGLQMMLNDTKLTDEQINNISDFALRALSDGIFSKQIA